MPTIDTSGWGKPTISPPKDDSQGIDTSSWGTKPQGAWTPTVSNQDIEPASDRYIDSLNDNKVLHAIVPTLGPAYNDDEKESLKKIWKRPDLTYAEKAEAVKTMGDSNYYFDEKTGLPVPIKEGQTAPKGKDVASVWGSKDSAEGNGAITTFAKNVVAAVPQFIKAIVDIPDELQGIVTDKQSDWRTAVDKKLDSLVPATSSASKENFIDTEAVNSVADLFDSKNWHFSAQNIAGNMGQLVNSVAQFMAGGELAKGVGMGVKSVKAIEEAMKVAREGAIAEGATTEAAEVVAQQAKKAMGMGTRMAARQADFAGSFIANFAGVSQSAKDAGLSARESALAAFTITPFVAAVDMNLGVKAKLMQAPEAGKETASIIKKAVENYAKAIEKDSEGNIVSAELKKKALNNLYKETAVGVLGVTKKYIGQIGEGMAEEGGQEGLQQVIQTGGEQIYDTLFAGDKKEGEGKYGSNVLSAKAFADDLNNIIGGAMGGGVGEMGFKALKKAKEEVKSQSVYDAVTKGKTDEFTTALSSAVKRGDITEDQKGIALQKLNAYQEYQDQTKNLKLDDKSQRRVFDLTFSNENLNTQIAELNKDPKSKEDGSIQSNNLAILNKMKKDNNDEIKKLLSKPIVEQQSATAEKTEEDLLKDDEKVKPITKHNKANGTTPKKDVQVEKVPVPEEKDWSKKDAEEIEKMKTMTPEEIDTHLDNLSFDLNEGEELPKTVVNWAENRKAELSEPSVPEQRKTPAQIAKETFSKHIEAINAVGDDMGEQKNFDKLEKIKNRVKDDAKNLNIPVPKEVTDAINNKENAGEKVKAKKAIEDIGLQHEKNIEEGEAKVKKLHEEISGFEKNKVAFTGEEEDEKFVAEQKKADPDFASRMAVHDNLKNADDKLMTSGQEEAIHALHEAGILESQFSGDMAGASEEINKAVKRIQWLKVNSKDNAKAAQLEQLTKKIFAVLSEGNKLNTAKENNESFKKLASKITEKNAEKKKSAISKAIEATENQINFTRENISRKKEKSQGTKKLEAELKQHEAHIKNLNKLLESIETLHPSDTNIDGTKKDSVKKAETKKEKVAEVKKENKTPVVDNLEAKKADIERGKEKEKQEVLNKVGSTAADQPEAPIYTLKDGKKYYRMTGSLNAKIKGTVVFSEVGNKNNEFTIETELAKSQITKIENKKGEVLFDNAKYDAELATLKKTESDHLTNEASKTETSAPIEEKPTEKTEEVKPAEEKVIPQTILSDVISHLETTVNKISSGKLVDLGKGLNNQHGVELIINGKKVIARIASSSVKVSQNANQKSTGKALQGTFGVVPKALVDKNVELHLVKVGDVDATGRAWNLNGEIKDKSGVPYGDKVEVWSGNNYLGVLQATDYTKKEETPKTKIEEVQKAFDAWSEKFKANQQEKNPHEKGTAAWAKFEKERNARETELEKENPMAPKKQGLSISNAQIKEFLYGILEKVLNTKEKLWTKDKGLTEVRKYITANELTVEQALDIEHEYQAAFETEKNKIENNPKLTEEQKDEKIKNLNDIHNKIKDVSTATMTAQARFFVAKAKLHSMYAKVSNFDNDTQTEKMLNEIMLQNDFIDGKPFEANYKAAIDKLYKEGQDEKSDKKMSLAQRLNDVLNEKPTKEDARTGAEKIEQLSMFFRSTVNQPYIAMNIASGGKLDLLFVNGAYEQTLKDRVLNALEKISDKQFKEKIANFKNQDNIENQIALLTDLTGLEDSYWRTYLNADSFKGKATRVEHRILKNVIQGWNTNTSPAIKTKQDFINNLVNKKGSVINTIRLATPEHEQLSVISPRFKDSEWNFKTSSSFVSHLVNTMRNINNEVYQSKFFKGNGIVEMYKGKPNGATIFMGSGASNVKFSKKYNAENMSSDDIAGMMYAAFADSIKDAPKSEFDNTYLQCLGQYGDKGFLAWMKVPKYTIEQARKEFVRVHTANGFTPTQIAEQEKMLLSETHFIEKQIKLTNEQKIAGITQAEMAREFLYNYAVNYADANQVINGGLEQYKEKDEHWTKAVTNLFKRNGSTASPGEYGNKYIEGGLGDSHGVVLINAPSVNGFNLGDGQEYITREHSDKISKSTGGKYHSIIKAISSFINPDGSRVLIKSGAIVIDELVKQFPDNEAYKALLQTMNDAKVGRIVTVDAAKFKGNAQIYNLFKKDSHELNPDAGKVSDKHIINVKTDDYLFQQDLVNDGKLKQSTTPIQRIKNMMGSDKANEIQRQYNEIAKKKLEEFSKAITNTYDDKEKFTQFLLTSGNISAEEAKEMVDNYKEQGATDDDLDFINTLLVAGVDTTHPILHSWAQKFIGNTIEKEALGRIANKVQLVEFAHIPGKGFELRDYRKTPDGKTLMPEVAVPKSTGLRLPKVFRTLAAARKAIFDNPQRYRDMYDGKGITEGDYGNIHEHEIEKVGKVWIVPGEYVMVTRVPADGMHSTSLARVKYSTPKEMGNVIITSTQMQKLSGSDFDGDQRFVEGFFKGKEGDIIKDKVTGEPKLTKNGKEKRYAVASSKETPQGFANKAFHSDAQYFYDKNNYDEITNPIDGEYFDDSLDLLPKEKETAVFGPSTFLNARTKNTTGLKVVGIAARFIGAYDYLKKHNSFLQAEDAEGKKKLYKFPLDSIGKERTGKEWNLSSFAPGWQMKKVMGNLLNLALDNVKNPKIERLGLNEVTAPSFFTALMMKPDDIEVKAWTEHVIAYFTQPEIQKYVRLAREANSVQNEKKANDLISQIGKTYYDEQTGQRENDYSTFSKQEQEVLKYFKTIYKISQDVNKVSTVIGASENGMQGWADYHNTKMTIDDVVGNQLKNINTEGFAGSPFVESAIQSADAMKAFLEKDAYEETPLGQQIVNNIEHVYIDNYKEDEEPRLTAKQYEVLSKAISDTVLTLSRNLSKSYDSTEFVRNILNAQNGTSTEKSLVEKIKYNSDRIASSNVKGEQAKQLQEKIDKWNAQNTIIQMLQEKERSRGAWTASKDQVKSTAYKSLGLRVDLQKIELSTDQKNELNDAWKYLLKHDPEFVKRFTDFAIFDTNLSTSKESGGFAQIMSPEVHKLIADGVNKEIKKWQDDTYTPDEKRQILATITENNPELLDKQYVKKFGESYLKKDYVTFAGLTMNIVSETKMQGLMDGSQDTLGVGEKNKDVMDKAKVGSVIEIKQGDKSVQRKIVSIVPFDANQKLNTGITLHFEKLGETKKEEDKTEKFERSNKIITRQEVQKNKSTLYVFGDNDIRKGLGGQAKEMRGEPNAFGISTKKIPSNDVSSFKSDKELEENKKIITSDVNKIIAAWNTGKYDNIIIPPIGVGLAKLSEKAPMAWKFLNEEIDRLKNIVNQKAKEEVKTENKKEEKLTSMDELTNHSGGAYGADTEWDVIGRKFGVTQHNHYREASNTSLSKRLRNSNVSAKIITEKELQEGYNELEKVFGKKFEKSLANDLKARNLMQVKNSDAVFAIAHINLDNFNSVSGGTNAAIQFAIKAGKPVNVFNLTDEKWYKWDDKTKEFEKQETPILIKNFAGIGTRDIENYQTMQNGKWTDRKEYIGKEKEKVAQQAITDVYQKTKDSIEGITSTDAVAQWEEYGERIAERYLLITKEDWMDMTEAERKKAIECL